MPAAGEWKPVRRSTESERVQVDENLARTRTIFRPDDALLLHDLHDPRRPVVTDSQPTLEHRRAGAFARLQYVKCLLIQFLVVAQVAVVVASTRAFFVLLGGAIDLLLNRLRVLWRAIAFEELHHLLHFFVGH